MSPRTPLSRLETLTRNLWWTWNPEIISIFRDLNPAAWRSANHNPIQLLQEFDPEHLPERAKEVALDSRIHHAFRRLAEYLSTDRTWAQKHAGLLLAEPVAYFVAEFGIHESLPLYSGGLGLLAGDTLKSASDLGVPFVGIGIFYAQSYFRQRLDAAGNQIEEYGRTPIDRLPLHQATGPDGRPLLVSVEMGHDTLHAAIWHAEVGRSKLVLLDSDVPENTPENRALTSVLYGGDRRMRMRQELVLGIGGLRALRALGIRPSVLHLNEGHSAFATLERIRERMEEDGMSFEVAARETAQRTVFTTHTPVVAGHDRFDPDLVEEHLGWLRERLGLSREAALAFGRVNPGNPSELFCMTVLALKLSRHANGVSNLHGHVSRQMWQSLWPQRLEREVPIGHITNGIHLPSWVSPAMDRLFERHIGRDWTERACDADAWEGIANVDDGELWEVHQNQRFQLVEFARRRCTRQAQARGESAEALEYWSQVLDPDLLTIGFARRFVTYKRSTLIMADVERLARLVGDAARPIQIIFAGKAHPQDGGGKALIRDISQLCREARFQGRLVFIEDYDINVGRHLVQGADVWLNTPVRPMEACGTSGQKAAVNGILNLAVLDGWWAEAYDGRNGFAIGNNDMHVDFDEQSRRDAASLYRVLEQEVIPTFYDRSVDDLPLQWISRMKRSIRTLAWRFNADRMVKDYVRRCYIPAAGGTSCDMAPVR